MKNINFVPVQVYSLWLLDSYDRDFEGRPGSRTLMLPATTAQRLGRAGYLIFRGPDAGWVCAADDLDDMLLALPDAFIARC